MTAGGPTRTIASAPAQARVVTLGEALRPDERLQGVQQLTAIARKPWTALKSLKSILKNQNAHVKRDELSAEFAERLLDSWFKTFVVYTGEGGAQDRSCRQHCLRNIREHGDELRPSGILVGHSNLLALHGLRTRYVTGALLASRRWLQRMGWVRRAAVSSPRPSGTTTGGDAA